MKRDRGMSMKMTIRKMNDVTILDLSERVALGEESARLCDAVREVLLKGSIRIIVNLGEVIYIDSSGWAN